MFCYFTGDERWMIWWVSVFLGIYVGAEVATGSLIYTYVVKRAIGTEQDGYLMTFVFWALIALGRLTAVPLSLVLSGLQMLFINLVGCIAAPAVILFFPDSLPVLWGAVGFYGFFMASSFPTAFVVAESMIMISGSIASLFVVGSGMGEIIIPTAVTELFGTSLSYFSLIYTMLFCACMGLLCWFGMLWRYKSMEKRGVLPFQMEQVKREKGEGEGGGAGEEGGRNGRKYEYRDEESVLLDASKA
jgi:fucose permease